MNIQIFKSLGAFGGNERVPFKFDSALLLDGTILKNGSTYYFLDKSGNARHFLINNYDFPDNWSGGFPYKSAATISAPSGDTAFRNADVNNFFYSTGGTPNQIPVISLFQDVDYAHKLFCKHQNQMLDINGVEWFEPRVKEIVLYNNIKTGSDLIRCNSYYSVPEKLTIGIREVGAGKTYSTIGAAITAASAGETIYVYTGAYSESLVNNKNINIIGVGNCKITAAATTRVINFSATSGTPIFEGFSIDCNLRSYCFGYQGSLTSLTINRVNVYNGQSTLGLYTAVNDACVININNSIFSCSTLETTNMLNVNTVKHIPKLTTAGYSLKGAKVCNILNCKISTNNSGLISINANVTLTIKGGNYYNSLIIPSATPTAATVNITNINLTIDAAKSPIVNNNTGDGISYTIQNSIINQTYASYMGSFISLANFNAISILNNEFVTPNFRILLNPATNKVVEFSGNKAISGNILTEFRNVSFTGNGNNLDGNIMMLFVDNTDVVVSAPVLRNNRIVTRNESGSYPAIAIGNEVNGFNYLDGAIVEKNTLIGPISFGVTTLVNHSLPIFWQKNCKIRYNYIEGWNIGALVKSDGRESPNEISYNVIKNCKGGLLAKGAKSVLFYGNTVITDIDYVYFAQIMSNELVINSPSQNCKVKNNILIDNRSELSASGSVYIVSDNDCLTGLDVDNNVYYSMNSANTIANVNSSALTKAQWEALGFDLNSLNQKPALSMGLWPTTPIITGENLGTTYKDALGIISNFGSTTQIPNIIISEQPTEGTWQVGAFHQ